MKYDVAVVGAGPVGSIAAERASRDNDVVLVGANHVVQCAGLVSISGLQRLGVEPGGFILNKVRGAKLVSPLGFQTVIDGGRDKAYVLDRLAFDDHLLNSAVSAGANYISSPVDSENGMLKTPRGEEINSEKIVLATGTNYTLQKKLGLQCPRDFLVGAQYEMSVECDKDFVELHFIVPDFFAWIIPVDGYARVGLCARQNAKKRLDDFVGSLRAEGRLKSDRRISEVYGIVPIHEPSIRTQYERIVTVGDAAGQVKASSGGGIVFGGLAAEVACNPDYESEWRKRIGRELRLHLMLHNFFKKLKPDTMDRVFRFVDRYKEDLEDVGDMDYVSKTFKGLLAQPKFAVDLLLNLPQVAFDLI